MSGRVGIIGCGTIGKYLAEHVLADADAELAFILVRAGSSSCAGLERYQVTSIEEAKLRAPDLVVECADSVAVRELALSVLAFSDLVVFSLAAFHEEQFERQIRGLCRQSGRHLYVPHGAILGLDGIRDAGELLQSVQVTTTKRPKNLGRDDISKTEVYRGPTRDACRLFPRNVNVHAALALAGLGFDRTISIIVSDPQSPGNAHRIDVAGAGFTFAIDILSTPQGLVSGAYTPVSAYNAIRRIMGGEAGFAIA